MKKRILILIVATTGLFSCKQNSKSTSETVGIKTLDSTTKVKNQKVSAKNNENKFYTIYEYNESNGVRLIIQNSFSKSGINYTDPNGKKFLCCILDSNNQ